MEIDIVQQVALVTLYIGKLKKAPHVWMRKWFSKCAQNILNATYQEAALHDVTASMTHMHCPCVKNMWFLRHPAEINDDLILGTATPVMCRWVRIT